MKSNVDLFEDTISEKFKKLQVDFAVNEKHVKRLTGDFEDVVEQLTVKVDELKVENAVKTITDINEQNLFKVKGELEDKVTRLEGLIEEYKEKVAPTVKVGKMEISEGLLNIPPSVDNSDPLTPLDQNFVTMDQLQKHYKLFVNRVQQQLATLGGGGEVFLARMEVVAVGSGIQTDGYVLKWDTASSLFVPGEASSSIAGIATTATSYFKDVEVSGDLDVSGDLVYDEAVARNWNITGVATAARFIGTDLSISGVTTVSTLDITGIATVGILTAYESISIGGTNIFTAIEGRTTIGLALALG